ncbi:MAG: replication-relaxation family protein [Oligoflexia bacterium]|nr:replication-relaxation family protein [Oligoflexia bacterium]
MFERREEAVMGISKKLLTNKYLNDLNKLNKKNILKSQNKAPQATDRDLLLLELLESYGVLSTQQIRQLVFKDINTRTVLRRLRVLKQRGFIYSSEGLPNGSLAWILSKKSAKLFKHDIETKVINKNSLQHDVAVSAIRIHLQKLNIAKSWTAEHVLRKELISSCGGYEGFRKYQDDLYLIPDSLFTVKDDEGEMMAIALELELCLKSKARYEKIFSKYQKKENIGFVWYVVLNKSVGEVLSKLWDKYVCYGKCQFAYSSLKEVFREDFKLPKPRHAGEGIKKEKWEERE